MKLKHILIEAVSQGDSNDAVYNLVLAYLKTDKNTMSDIKEKMFNSDEFWSSELDNVNKALSSSVDEAIEAILDAANAIGDTVKDHYSNAWNHQPGYKKPSTLDFDADEIPYTEVLEVVKKLAPSIHDKHIEDLAAAKKAASEKQKELIKALGPLLPSLAQTIIIKYDKAWGDYLKWLKSNPNSGETKNFIADRKLNLAELKTGKELAAAVRRAADNVSRSEEWMHDTFETLVSGDALDETDRQTLVSVMYHKNTAKKLWNLISHKVGK